MMKANMLWKTKHAVYTTVTLKSKHVIHINVAHDALYSYVLVILQTDLILCVLKLEHFDIKTETVCGS